MHNIVASNDLKNINENILNKNFVKIVNWIYTFRFDLLS